jgi:hypothetical protein
VEEHSCYLATAVLDVEGVDLAAALEEAGPELLFELLEGDDVGVIVADKAAY